MAQSLARLWTHLIFSTKNRFPFLSDQLIRAGMHGYLAKVLREHDCETLIVGGVGDHVHALFALSKTIPSPMSSKRSNARHPAGSKKSHPDRLSSIGKMGTGHSPSVSQSNLDQVIRYIETQDEHHQRVTFQDEYRAFLKAYGIESTNGTCGTEPAARTLSGYTQFENVFFLPGCYPGL